MRQNKNLKLKHKDVTWNLNYNIEGNSLSINHMYKSWWHLKLNRNTRSFRLLLSPLHYKIFRYIAWTLANISWTAEPKLKPSFHRPEAHSLLFLANTTRGFNKQEQRGQCSQRKTPTCTMSASSCAYQALCPQNCGLLKWRYCYNFL
jgi:hypothetical protein